MFSQLGYPEQPTKRFPRFEVLMTRSFPHFGHAPILFCSFNALVMLDRMVSFSCSRVCNTVVSIFLDSWTVWLSVLVPSAILFMFSSSCAVRVGLVTSKSPSASMTAMPVEVGRGVVPVTYFRE